MDYIASINSDIETFMADGTKSASMYQSHDEHSPIDMCESILDHIRQAQTRGRRDIQWDLGVFTPIMYQDGNNSVPGYIQNINRTNNTVDIVLKNGDVRKSAPMNTISALNARNVQPNEFVSDYQITDMYFDSGEFIKVPINGIAANPEDEAVMQPILYVKHVSDAEVNQTRSPYIQLTGYLQVNLVPSLNVFKSMQSRIKSEFKVDDINWFVDRAKRVSNNSRSYYFPVTARALIEDLPSAYVSSKENVMAQNYIMQVIHNVYDRAHDPDASREGTIEQYTDDGMGVGSHIVPFVFSVFKMDPNKTVDQYVAEAREAYREMNPDDKRDPFSNIDLLKNANQKLRNKYFPIAKSRPETIQSIINDVADLAREYRAKVAMNDPAAPLPEPDLQSIIEKHKQNINTTRIDMPQFVRNLFDLMYSHGQKQADIYKAIGHSRYLNNMGYVNNAIERNAHNATMHFLITQLMAAVKQASSARPVSSDAFIAGAKGALKMLTPVNKRQLIDDLLDPENDEIYRSIFDVLRSGTNLEAIRKALLDANSIDTVTINRQIQRPTRSQDTQQQPVRQQNIQQQPIRQQNIQQQAPGMQAIPTTPPADTKEAPKDTQTPGSKQKSENQVSQQVQQLPIYKQLHRVFSAYGTVRDTYDSRYGMRMLGSALGGVAGIQFDPTQLQELAEQYDTINNPEQYVSTLLNNTLTQNNNNIDILKMDNVAEMLWDFVFPANGIPS